MHHHLLLIVVLLAACKPPESAVIKQAPPPVVRVIHAQKSDVIRSISVPARVRAWQETTILARASGYLKRITVDRGDSVKSGSALAELDAPVLVADLAMAQAELAVAELEAGRMTEAMKRSPDLVSPQEADAAKAKAQIARAMQERSEALVGFATVTAPFDGIITQRLADPGAFIEADRTPLAKITDMHKVRVELDLTQPEVVHLKSGMQAVVTLDELPGRRFESSVSRFAEALDPATKTMPVEVDVDNADHTLRPGMFASVRLDLESRQGVLMVPAEVLMVEKKKTFVLLHRDGKAVRTSVKTGFDDGVQVEILEGVTTADEIIASGQQSLSDGQTVAVAK